MFLGIGLLWVHLMLLPSSLECKEKLHTHTSALPATWATLQSVSLQGVVRDRRLVSFQQSARAGHLRKVRNPEQWRLLPYLCLTILMRGLCAYDEMSGLSCHKYYYKGGNP